MAVIAVVGAQWGDEGKGRIIDYLAQEADVVIRFQGGDNAGHTVINAFGKHALHLIPSGIFNPRTQNIIGSGCVVNPQSLLQEMEALRAFKNALAVNPLMPGALGAVKEIENKSRGI